MTAVATEPKLYAVISLFGHARIAGAVSEQTLGGASFIRVDVPAVAGRVAEPLGWTTIAAKPPIAAHTRTLGPAAVYSIDWCDEETALVAAAEIRHEPLRPYSLREAINSLPAADRHRLLTSHRADQTDLDDNPF